MAWWSRPVAMMFSVLVVGASVPAAAQSPEARPGRPGWSRAASGCHVWNPDPQPGATVIWAGACENGRASGPGKLSWRYDGTTDHYEGEMRDGKAHGRGIVVTADGGRYDGEWREGNEHGRGTWAGANGDRYDGEWRDGKPHGRGTWTWASGDRYDGEWRDDERHGRGTFVRANGDRYDGEYRDSQQHGRGTHVWANGDRYDGEVSNGKPQGRGTWTAADGNRYDGEWREGLADGIGAFRFAGSDETYSGLWRRGCFRDGDRRASFGVPLSNCP